MNVVSYPIRDIVMEAKREEAKGKKMIYLNIGDPPLYGFKPFEAIVDEVKRSLGDNFKGLYGEHRRPVHDVPDLQGPANDRLHSRRQPEGALRRDTGLSRPRPRRHDQADALPCHPPAPRHSLSFKGREIVQSTFLHTPRRDFLTIAKAVLLFTLITEAGGEPSSFYSVLSGFLPRMGSLHAVYNAISAFNNCGYSLFSDNLMGYQGDLIVNLTIMGLIVHGGIGFIVQYEVLSRLRGLQKKLSIHAKM
jgi:hypothetical protein